MSRRRAGLPWAPTSLPQMHRQWCDVLDAGLTAVRERAAAATSDSSEWDALLPQAERDLSGLRQSALFWVARDMVDLAVEAAASLPEWSPAAAIPDEFGLLCWSKPVGLFDWPVPGTQQRVRMPVDAMSWGIRDGHVGVSCAVRAERIADQLGHGLASQPLLSHPVGMWPLEEPVAHRLEGGEVSPLSVLGTAWLLMDQPSVVETRTLNEPSHAGDRSERPDQTRPVSIIELRRIRQGLPGTPTTSPGRRYDKRFWVAGHWRQQACGPGRTLRKPVWISPFLKGPDDVPLSTRVYLWRR